MSVYAELIGRVSSELERKKDYEKRLERMSDQLLSSQKEYLTVCDAQALLATVADDNTEATLSYVTKVVNKTLAELFKNDVRRIYLKKKIYSNVRPHIVVELMNGRGESLDLTLQSGTGVKQVVSWLYSICLIEIRKGRRLIISDEKLSGLHKEAKRVISNIIQIFAEGGFQFIMVEYGLNDIGLLYNVEMRGDTSVVKRLDGEYDDSMVYSFDKEADLSILDEEDEVYEEDEGFVGAVEID